MLRAVHFQAATRAEQHLTLGLFTSRNVAEHLIVFSVPAHVFATLNVVIGGSLRSVVSGELLPTAFATGAQARAVRYLISPGATLVTLFCRCELLAGLVGARADAASVSCDAWLSADALFPAFVMRCEANDLADVEACMWAAVSPMHWQVLGARAAAVRNRARLRMDACLRELVQGPLAASAPARRSLSRDRQLQRDFARHWGMPLKTVQRMLRLQRGLQLWQQCQPHQSNMGLAELAAALGLADQAHLAKEFRELVGEPPSALRSTGTSDPLGALAQGGASLLPLFEQSLVCAMSEISKT